MARQWVVTLKGVGFEPAQRRTDVRAQLIWQVEQRLSFEREPTNLAFGLSTRRPRGRSPEIRECRL
jgi:hypothetical protein